MPLRCDCFPGCWGEHSENWTRIWNDPDVSYSEARRKLQYGSYVQMTDHIRVEDPKDLAKMLKPSIRLVNKLGFWAVRFVSFDGARYVQVNWIKRSLEEAIHSLKTAYYWGQVLKRRW